MKPNPGQCPPDAEGRRVNVLLRNGSRGEGWAADGRSGCRWSTENSPHDIVEYEVAG